VVPLQEEGVACDWLDSASINFAEISEGKVTKDDAAHT